MDLKAFWDGAKAAFDKAETAILGNPEAKAALDEGRSLIDSHKGAVINDVAQSCGNAVYGILFRIVGEADAQAITRNLVAELVPALEATIKGVEDAIDPPAPAAAEPVEPEAPVTQDEPVEPEAPVTQDEPDPAAEPVKPEAPVTQDEPVEPDHNN